AGLARRSAHRPPLRLAALGRADHLHRRQPRCERRHRPAAAISRIIAGWPALALLIAVKLLSGMLEHRNTEDGPATVPDAAVPAWEPRRLRMVPTARPVPRPGCC